MRSIAGASGGAGGAAAGPGRQATETPPQGCILAGDEVAFVFDERAHRQAFPALVPAEVRRVALAGDFNHFDPGRPGWALSPRGDGTWALSVPSSAVQQGERYAFVVNGEALPPLPTVDGRFLLPTDGEADTLIVGGEPRNPWLERMEEARYRDALGRTLPYLLLPPDPCDPARRYPLILFLHGSGERGGDNRVQVRVRNGAHELLEAARGRAFFLLAPQAPRGARWDGVEEQLLGALGEVRAKYPIDGARISVVGISMGGFEAWRLAARRPELLAAAVPVCGGGDPLAVTAMKGVAVWAFHGARDPSVPVERSRAMVAALRAAGGDVRYTEYPDGDHFVWARSLGDPALVEWLFAKARPETGR